MTVRFSTTYFFDPARNTIFLWTGLVLAGEHVHLLLRIIRPRLVLANEPPPPFSFLFPSPSPKGLLSLTVEFFRSNPSPCAQPGKTISQASDFPYGEDTTCGLVCSETEGPFSPIRQGSTNNIYVIPAPQIFTFGTATLVAAACCIPAILSMVTMWNKILEINWKAEFADEEKTKKAQELIPGTNGATIGKMEGVNYTISRILAVIEALVLGGAVLTILVIGELNFWSHPVNYQTEPMSGIGKPLLPGTVPANLRFHIPPFRQKATLLTRE